MQHVHQDLPLLPGPVRVRRSAGGSAGDYYLSEVVLLQHLRDFGVVAGHSGAAVDCLLEEAVQEDSAGAGNRRTFCRRAGQCGPAPEVGPQASDRVTECLPRAGPHYALVRAHSYTSTAQMSAEDGREVAAGAVRDVGRAGRDLSGD